MICSPCMDCMSLELYIFKCLLYLIYGNRTDKENAKIPVDLCCATRRHSKRPNDNYGEIIKEAWHFRRVR